MNSIQSSPHLIKPPSLLWILRDFSLQLITKENQEISSDEYLENCLSLETKNNKNETMNGKQEKNNCKNQTKNERGKSK